MPSAYLALHLHAHLPFVRHPEFPSFLEERWFFDAIVDTYVPLISAFERLHLEGVPYRLSMTLSPTLLSMFADALLQERFGAFLESQTELSVRELERTEGSPTEHRVAQMYSRRLGEVHYQFNRFGRNLARAFSMLSELGHLELITCAATHCFLPHQQLVPGSVERQLRAGAEVHARILGRAPDGVWIPECAYYPGLERELERCGLLYFFVDSHALELGRPRSLRGVHSHVYLPNGVAAFGRDLASGRQVWSAREGYPGDALYRDFYRDIGFDQPLDYVAPYIHDRKIPILTGFKYHAISGESEHKEIYQPDAAAMRAEQHALHFVAQREQQAVALAGQLDRDPLIVSPYDAELFGHWWYEGPLFLYHVLRATASSRIISAVAARDYLQLFPTAQVVEPNASSWGDGGYFRFWINNQNEWIYPHLNAAGRVIEALPEGTSSRLRRQLARELLLAQCSDWPFIMSTGTSPAYAGGRVSGHLDAFNKLYAAAQAGQEPLELADYEFKDNCF